VDGNWLRVFDAAPYPDDVPPARPDNAIWQLTKDPCWRTSTSGEVYTYNGTTYNCRALNSTLSGYTDAITVSVTASGAANPLTTSFRYYVDTPFLVRKPIQVCCDSGIYFADSDNHSIWKIDATTGAIIRVAGDGLSGYSGDGVLATEARLHSPHGVALDSFGNIYIADTDNHRIRKLDAATQIISTLAGTGLGGLSGDGGLGTSGKLQNPGGVYLDSNGNIFIADTKNHRLRVVSVHDGKINTVGGMPTGSGGFNGDNRPATDAYLNDPKAAAMASTRGARRIYISDTENNRIRMLTFKIERVLY